MHIWRPSNDFSLRGIWNSLTNFTTDISDLVSLSLLRFGSLSGLAYLGSKLSWKEAEAKERAKIKPKPESCNGKAQPTRRIRNGEHNGQHNGDIREPLLLNEDDKNEKPTTVYEEWFSGSSKKDVVLFVVFLLCTAFQVIFHFYTFCNITWFSVSKHILSLIVLTLAVQIIMFYFG